jgi:hypothetical protein
MTTHLLQFVELSERERKTAQPLGKLGKGVQVEVRVRRRSGKDQVVKLSAQVATLLESALSRLLEGDGSLSSPKIRSSVQTMRLISWAFPARLWFIGWIWAIFRSGMSESIGGRS